MSEKVFEDHFLELQTDMVAIASEYVDKKADSIYIYCSYEHNMYNFNVFYKIEGTVVRKHKLNGIVPDYHFDVSENRQDALLDIGTKDLNDIYDLCIKYKREMPTEIKLIYDVKKNSLDAEYSYELKYSNTQDLTSYHIFNQWFDEVAKENGQK